MPLSPRLLKRVQVYRQREAANGRGPRFKRVALTIEQEMRSQAITRQMLLEWFGVPDKWGEDDVDGFFLYYFDHQEAGRNGHEWYFHLKDQKLTDSGYNLRGINEFGRLKSAGEFPPYEA